ncbi:MAG: release factor glutamine methyltransferase [Fimbriimonadales bacterium]|nr:MAG: release factor glutamine methyltransferase [Fimbriimonadales bacterium]
MIYIMTIAESIHQTRLALQAAGIADAPREAEVLLAACLGLSRAQLIAHSERLLNSSEQQRLHCWLRRRANREPLAYITRRAWFYGLELIVGRGVLIPRPETEVLVELFLEWATRQRHEAYPILVDAGTGSAAIALACLQNAPEWRGIGIDCTQRALQMARRNRRRLNQGSRLLLIQSDWLSALRPCSVNALLSNPPYVLPEEWDALQPEIRWYEPRRALLVPADDPLQPYRQLVKAARCVLRSPGLIALETSPRLAPDVAECLAEHGFAHPRVRADYSGVARVVWATV